MWLNIVSFILALGILSTAVTAEVPLQGKAARIGMLLGVSPDFAAPYMATFRQGLHELGYTEGQNIAIESRFATGNGAPLSDLVAALVRLPVDVIVTWGTPAALAAKHATSTIPIVMATVFDPVGTGLVAGLARPGGNVTGVTSGVAALSGKNLELLTQLIPGVTRVAVLWASTNPANALMLKETKAAAQALGLQAVHRGHPRAYRVRQRLRCHDQSARRGSARAQRSVVPHAPNADRGPRGQEPAARDV